MPHRSRRGPNGIWLITRGPDHPLVRLFSRLRASYVTVDGEPIFYEDESYSRYKAAVGIDLFFAEEDALEEAEFEREMHLDDVSVAVATAAGAELLALIAGIDLVRVDGVGVGLSRPGELVVQMDEEERVDTRAAFALAAALGADIPRSISAASHS